MLLAYIVHGTTRG